MKKELQRLIVSTALAGFLAWPGVVVAAPAPLLVLGMHPGSPNGAVVVKPGETVEGIARRYDISAHDLAAINDLTAPYALWTGERLLLPVPREHKVGANDTLTSLSRMYGLPLKRLAEANNLKAPYRLYEGQVLRIPHEGDTNVSAAKPAIPRAVDVHPPRVKQAEARHPAPPGQAEKVRMLKKPGPSKEHRAFSAMIGKIAGSDPKKEAKQGHPAHHAIVSTPMFSRPEEPRAQTVSYSRREDFIWPVRGQVISSYGPKEGGLYNDGINIAAPRGTPVGAAAAGVIAYVGDTLHSYGNLVLIRHGGGMVTAYAHLNTVTVREGMHVSRGQTIGSVGSTGTVAHAQLHFEVRHGTEKINPQRYLG